MLSVAYSPHPFQPASIQTSGQGRRTTESLVGYQGFHLSGAASMHPSQSGCWVYWGLYRTSGHHPFSGLGLLHWSTDHVTYGYSVRPWRSKASKTHLFDAWVLVSLAVLVRWTTNSIWLAGATCPTTVLVGISTAWVLRLCRQTGTLEEPGHSSPQVTMGTMAASNWGLSASFVGHGSTCSVPWHWCWPIHWQC